MTKLDQYVFHEAKLRRRDGRVSLAIAMAVGTLLLLAGRSENESVLAGMVAMLASMTFFTLRFVKKKTGLGRKL